MAEKLFSGSESTKLAMQLVINGTISIGHVAGFFKRQAFPPSDFNYIWKDWHTKDVYAITRKEFLSIKPYPESPIPEPGAET
jgi:hypothetical protein